MQWDAVIGRKGDETVDLFASKTYICSASSVFERHETAAASHIEPALHCVICSESGEGIVNEN
jgi:hypothetical protein